MKTTTAILFLCQALASFSQDDMYSDNAASEKEELAPQENIFVTEFESNLDIVGVLEFELDRNEMFSLSKMWVIKSFKSSERVIDYESAEDGIIKGNGAGMMMGMMTYTFTLEFKSGRMRYTFSNIEFPNGYSLEYWHSRLFTKKGKRRDHPSSIVNGTLNYFDQWIYQLAEYVSAPKKDDW